MLWEAIRCAARQAARASSCCASIEGTTSRQSRGYSAFPQGRSSRDCSWRGDESGNTCNAMNANHDPTLGDDALDREIDAAAASRAIARVRRACGHTDWAQSMAPRTWLTGRWIAGRHRSGGGRHWHRCVDGLRLAARVAGDDRATDRASVSPPRPTAGVPAVPAEPATPVERESVPQVPRIAGGIGRTSTPAGRGA